ncbi:MAG: potassium-transporting ATPase subunit F [Actinomycetota bacterium]|nr:potassium-transporting ATPase subunit F [Actinomycetota bacterium]
MSVLAGISLATAVLLLGYLVISLVRAEEF